MFLRSFFFFFLKSGPVHTPEARDRERGDAVGVSPRLFNRGSKIQNWVPSPWPSLPLSELSYGELS
jgi:hypothetical protein